MSRWTAFFLICMWSLLHYVDSNFDPYIDNIPYGIQWAGELNSAGAGLAQDELSDMLSAIDLVTSNNEKYRCTIPVTQEEDKDHATDYMGPAEMELLKPLFTQTSCSYRIESYWTYELCHGKHLRQYHEEKEVSKILRPVHMVGKLNKMKKRKPKLQEYFLGRSVTDPQEPAAASEEEGQQETQIPTPLPTKVSTKKVEGIEIPYFEIKFDGGTMCDLTGQPRKVALHYVCQPEGKGEIYELKEVITCEYEVVVLTNLLCTHPLYQIKKDPIHTIQCHSLDGAPLRPKSLDNLELENTQARYNKKQTFIIEPDPSEEEDETSTTTTTVEGDKDSRTFSKKPTLHRKPNLPESRSVSGKTTTIGSGADKQLLTDFLNGDYCIQGGTGWWKHEFCYGKSVTQFHEDAMGKTSILLGKWSQDAHVSWIQNNPGKRPKAQALRRVLSHYYGNGDTCDLTKTPRFTEVKFKCVESPNQPHAVGIFLVEPSTCEYTLVVESPIFCSLIKQANDDGLIIDPVL